LNKGGLCKESAATSRHEGVSLRSVFLVRGRDTAHKGDMGCRIGGQDGLREVSSSMVRALQSNES